MQDTIADKRAGTDTEKPDRGLALLSASLMVDQLNGIEPSELSRPIPFRRRYSLMLKNSFMVFLNPIIQFFESDSKRDARLQYEQRLLEASLAQAGLIDIPPETDTVKHDNPEYPKSAYLESPTLESAAPTWVSRVSSRAAKAAPRRSTGYPPF